MIHMARYTNKKSTEVQQSNLKDLECITKIWKHSTKFKARKTKYNPNMSCNHCMRTGHLRANCYKLIGFPDDFQFTKSNVYQGEAKANAVVGAKKDDCTNNPSSERSMGTYSQHFSKEQLLELVNLIKQVPLTRRGQVFGEIRDGLYLLQPTNLDSSSFLGQNVVSIPKECDSSCVLILFLFKILCQLI
uniref:Uncharacterized protein n=1 Tax=Nicotiana tabacum TaxID=4097 RepID=A0A1S3XU06_TOBAC|nr:PREDICTED: uncharacterized protein LOC107768567 [Nicotiana tabacum]